MNKFILSIFATAICLSTLTVTAATTTDNKDDASALGTSDTPQIKEQNKQIDKKASNKSLQKNGMMNHSNEEMKMMDTNNNGMVSKDEYMQYHTTAYGKMKQENGGVGYENSMNKKPIGTTSGQSKNGSEDITRDGAVNGTVKGTN